MWTDLWSVRSIRVRGFLPSCHHNQPDTTLNRKRRSSCELLWGQLMVRSHAQSSFTLTLLSLFQVHKLGERKRPETRGPETRGQRTRGQQNQVKTFQFDVSKNKTWRNLALIAGSGGSGSFWIRCQIYSEQKNETSCEWRSRFCFHSLWTLTRSSGREVTVILFTYKPSTVLMVTELLQVTMIFQTFVKYI